MKKIAVKNQKDMTVSVNADSERFGRLLVAVKNRDINLKEVLSYELCSVPISLAHPDGSLRKTTKKHPYASPRKGRHLQVKPTYFTTSYSISD